MNRPTRLIVNADDFGLHTSINEGILRGHERGIVTSCSLIVNADLASSKPYEDAVGIATDTDTLDVGLHFALVGLPGLPTGYRDFLTAYAGGRFPRSRVEQLLHRQIDILEQDGINPSHIDSHQHLHALPGIMRVVCDVAKRRGIRAIRLPLESRPIDAPAGRAAASRVLGLFAGASGRIIDRVGLWRPDRFLGMAVSGHLTEDALLGLIDRVLESQVTEIICHPASLNSTLRTQFDWGYEWEGELAAVTSERVKERIRERGIQLTTFAGEVQRP